MKVNSGKLTQKVSDYEQHIWLLQQQQPIQAMKHISSWRFNNPVNIARLVEAIQTVIEAIPDLNVRYDLNDDGELIKRPAQEWFSCVESLSTDSYKGMVEQTVAQQASASNLELDSPFKALIITCNDEIFISLILHEILTPTFKEQQILNSLQHAYYGDLAGASPLKRITLFHNDQRSMDEASTQPSPSTVGVHDVAAIILSEFREALSAPEMTLTDDFFDYGGHSLLATRVIGRLLGTHGLEVHFGDFFSYPTPITLAARALPAHQHKDTVSVPQQNRCVTAPLALAQASLWKAYEAYEFGAIFNLPFALDFLDDVDESLLKQAFSDLIARHPSLRTLYYAQHGEACQQVVDLAQVADYKWFWQRHESQNVTLRDEAAYRFDLAQELPIRIRLLHNPETGRQILSLLVHHMAIDEWSLNVMMAELSQAYSSRAADKAPVWQKPALPFHEFALRQQAEGVNQQHLAFWTNMLREATRGLTLPTPDHWQAIAAKNASQAGWLKYHPQPEVAQRLYTLARQNNASLFIIVYTAIALALHKLGDLQDIAIGTSAPGRTDPQTYETVGYFTTMVAHRIPFTREKSVKALIADVRDCINNSMPYADIPLDVIQQSLGIAPEEGLIFDAYIQIHANNALNGELETPSGNSIRYRQIDPDKTQSMFGLQFEIMEDVIAGEKSVRLVITYRVERYCEPQVQRICEVIDSILVFFTTPESLGTPLAQVPM